MLKRILFPILALLALAAPAAAAPCPWPFSYGQVLTTAQWNYCVGLAVNALPTSGGSMTGPLITAPSTINGAGFNIPAGIAPTAPNNGDMYDTLSGLFAYVNGQWVGPFPGTSATKGLGTSVNDPGTGNLEALIPVQTVTGASKTYTTADLFKRTRRTNSGSAMSDTLPAAGTTGLANGTTIQIANSDATAVDTITAGAGTTIGSGSTYSLIASRSVWFTYDLANTAWRSVADTTSTVSGPASSVNNDIVTFSGTSGLLIQDSGQVMPSGTLVATSTGSPAKGDVLYYNGTNWTDLPAGTSGFFLETLGAGANPAWAAAAGGSGCTISGGSQFQIIVNNGSSGCSSSANGSLQVGALTLGASGTLGSVSMGNATSGTVKVQPVTGALGSSVVSLPAVTGTALVTTTASPAQGDIEYFNGTNWVSLAAGTSGQVLKTNGAGANPAWTAAASGCTIVGGSVNNPITNNGSSGCQNDTSATLNAGALALGSSGVAGSVAMGNATSGTVTVQPVTGALGSVTASLPANTGTVAELNLAQTWTAVQSHNSGNLALNGATSGSLTVNCTATCGSNTATFPANTGTVAELNLAQTWTAAQSFNSSTLKVNGSTSGTMTVNCAATCGSNTMTLPAVTDTVAVLGTADQTVSGGANLTAFSIGTVSSGTTTIDCGKNAVQYLTNGGAFTFAAPSNDGACVVLVTNNGTAGTITFSGFSVGSNTGDALTTTNTNKFMISVLRINGTATYTVKALQ